MYQNLQEVHTYATKNQRRSVIRKKNEKKIFVTDDVTSYRKKGGAKKEKLQEYWKERKNT